MLSQPLPPPFSLISLAASFRHYFADFDAIAADTRWLRCHYLRHYAITPPHFAAITMPLRRHYMRMLLSCCFFHIDIYLRFAIDCRHAEPVFAELSLPPRRCHAITLPPLADAAIAAISHFITPLFADYLLRHAELIAISLKLKAFATPFRLSLLLFSRFSLPCQP